MTDTTTPAPVAGAGAPATASGPSDPRRLATGPPGALLHAVRDPLLGRVTVHALDPAADLDVLEEWVRRPGSSFWGLGDLTRAELRELYEHVAALPAHHAHLVRRDGLPVALLQTYEPAEDPVGERYPVRPGDVGVHLLLGARGPAVAGFTTLLADVLFGFAFATPGADRVVVEPDVRNARALDRMRALGFEAADVVEVHGKTAQLAFLTRAAWSEGRAARAEVQRAR